MAITPYGDLSSEDILSAHVSGLQHSVNKIEQVLNMKTASVTDHPLVAVSDQDDPSLRYRIYEGTIRGWLDNPAPVIYRNGEVVDPSEYVISPGHGVIVFHDQQLSTDTITADFTHIISGSNVIDGIQDNISTLSDGLGVAQADIEALETEVQNLQSQINSGLFAVNGQKFPMDPSRTIWANTLPGKTVDDLVFSDNILQVADCIDAFPIFIETRTIISKMRVDINSASVSADMYMGIYSDANAKPHELLASTAMFTASPGTSHIVDLQEPVVLDVGVYWVCRYQSAGIRVDGHNLDEQVMITFENASPVNGSGTVVGVRTESGAVDVTSGLPQTFPAIDGVSARYLSRADIGTVYALK